MKLWFLPVHIVKSSTVEEIKKEEAKKQRQLNNRLIAGLLKRNYKLEAMLRALAGGKKRKFRGQGSGNGNRQRLNIEY